MSTGMWNFEPDEETQKLPRDIVQEQCQILSDITHGRVIARIAEYDGYYKSQTVLTGLGGVKKSLNEMSGPIEKKFDIQEALGDGMDDSKLVYEFFLTSYNAPRYKYRICFIYYGVLLYPVGISLQKDIADEIKLKTEFEVGNEEEFKQVLALILGSKTLSDIINNLYKL